MSLTFEQPAYLALLALALPVLWIGWRSFGAMSGVRRASVVAIRLALIAVLVAMLAGAAAVRQTDQVAVVGVVDVSDSVRAFGYVVRADDDTAGADMLRMHDPLEFATQFLARAQAHRQPDDRLGVVAFATRAVALAAPSRARITERLPDPRLGDGTNIAEALRAAAAMLPPDAAGRLLLISDGNETAGDALAAARALGAGDRPVPVDVIPVSLGPVREVMIETVDVPPRAPAQATIVVRVTFFATHAARGHLTLLREGEIVDINGPALGFARPVVLPAGRSVELISVPLPPERVHRFTAIFEPEASAAGESFDTRPENNRGEAFTATPGRGTVLVVDGVGHAAPDSAGMTLVNALRRAGIDVAVSAPEGLAESLLALQAYDLVMLQNVPADAVSPQAQQALSSFVRDYGGGLVMIGGPDSFGAGGWKGSPLEPLLPVRLDLPEQLIQPDAAIVFVIDNSGSMGSLVLGTASTQQEIANHSAALAIMALDRRDLVGVIVFNSTTEVLIPLAPNTDPRASAEKVRSIVSGGGTVLGPALREAARQLGSARAGIKHVIVLSDGVSAGADTLPELAYQLRQAHGITISTIGVGDGMDRDTMARIAQAGGGEFFPVVNPALLPRFFLKAVRVVRQPLIREGSFTPVMLPVPSPLTAGLRDPPLLLGYVLTQPRREPTIVHAMLTPAGEPLLAHWNVELGRVAAWTSDAHRWAAPWLDWPGYGQMWTQIARTMARGADSSATQLLLDHVGDVLRMRLEASEDDGTPADLLSVETLVYAPGGTVLTTPLVQTAPGVYEGSVPAHEAGPYVVIAKPSREGTPRMPVVGGVAVASGAEWRALTANHALLSRIARETGGRLLTFSDASAAALFDRTGLRPATARTPLWRMLLPWAVVLMLLDVATRRVAWDRLISREFGVGLRRIAADAVRPRGREAVALVHRLRGLARRSTRLQYQPARGDATQPVPLGPDTTPETATGAERLGEVPATARPASSDDRNRLGTDRALATDPRPLPPDEPPGPRDETPIGGLLAAKRRSQTRFTLRPPTPSGDDRRSG